MEEINLVGEATKFMALGMGIVFLFLIIMIFVLKLQAYLIAKFIKEESPVVKNLAIPSHDDAAITAAITAAIIHHNTNIKG
jgi:oxaloacetate decarboxylase gamma subunit